MKNEMTIVCPVCGVKQGFCNYARKYCLKAELSGCSADESGNGKCVYGCEYASNCCSSSCEQQWQNS